MWMSRGTSPFGPWTEPINLGSPLNTRGHDSAPTLLSNDAHLYFESGRSGNFGAHDIWMTMRVPRIDYVQRAQEHVEQGRMDEAASDLALALSLTDGHDSADSVERARIVKQIVESDELFVRVVDLQPGVIGLWGQRGAYFERMGWWAEASECYRKRLELGPDGAGLWYHRAVALIAVNDLFAYRAVCEEMLLEFSEVADPQEAWFVAWSMAIGAESVADKSQALRMSETAMHGLPDASNGARAYAAWLYRLGRFEESIAVWESDARDDSEVVRSCFLAMAHHRLGHSEEALQYAEHIRSSASAWAEIMPMDHRVVAAQLRAEMEAVLAGELETSIEPAPTGATASPVEGETERALTAGSGVE